MTNNLVQRLCELASPPEFPSYNTGEWDIVEHELGLSLPDDYKSLIETFGQGVFAGQALYSGLTIISYLGPAKPSLQANGFCAYFRDVGTMRFGISPENPGLLGFGTYADKDTLAWNTSGAPEEWPIVFHDPETGFHEFNGIGLINFIISILDESSLLHKSGVIRMGHMRGPHTFSVEI